MSRSVIRTGLVAIAAGVAVCGLAVRVEAQVTAISITSSHDNSSANDMSGGICVL